MRKKLPACILAFCLVFFLPVSAGAASGETGTSADRTDAGNTEARETRCREAVSEEEKEILKNRMEMERLNISDISCRLLWIEAREQGKVPEKAQELAEEIRMLKKEFSENTESMEPYREARRACLEAGNTEGAKAAMENIICIQEERLEKKRQISRLWLEIAELVGEADPAAGI